MAVIILAGKFFQPLLTIAIGNLVSYEPYVLGVTHYRLLHNVHFVSNQQCAQIGLIQHGVVCFSSTGSVQSCISMS